MLVHISLVVALCSGMSMSQVNTRMEALESQNPGAKVTLKFDRKASCDGQGNPIEKAKKTRKPSKEVAECTAYDLGM